MRDRRQRPTSHRAAPAGFGLGRRALSALLAVLAVIVVIAVLLFFRSHGSTATHDTASSHRPPVTFSATPPSSSSPTASPPSVPATVHHTPHPAKPKPSPSHKPAHHSAPALSQARAPVAVLNNSRRTGLAHYVAAQVRDKDWDVYAVGNLRGRVLESTIYYAPGDEAAAEHLAREFGAIRRVLPNSELGLRTRGIALVLTRDWYG